MSYARGSGIVIGIKDTATLVSSKRYKRSRWRSVGKCCHPITTQVRCLYSTARYLTTVVVLLLHHPITALVPPVPVPPWHLTRLLLQRRLFSAFTSSL